MNKQKYPKHFLHNHSPEEIRIRLDQIKSHSYLRDLIYGGIDGTITTFAVVSGVVGANLQSKTIIILGFANLIADGFSMAASNYLGTKAENEEYLLVEKFEYEQVSDEPEGEKEEVRQILASKGFSGIILDQATDLFVKDEKRWIDLMLREEYGFASKVRSAVKAGTTTFFAFLIFGIIPLLPFIISRSKSSFVASCFLTGIAFFLVGSLKSRWTSEIFWKSGIKTFIVGSVAASLAYIIGVLLREIA